MAQENNNTNIYRTKLQRPSVAPDILPRARLLDRLIEGRQRPLTLISAPAGYGKSTLASLWMAECESPSGWVSLDESHRDPRVFLSYLLAAIRLLFPKATLRTEILLEAITLPSTPVLACHLVNDLHHISEPFILVLDDYHRIGETPSHDLISALLDHPLETMHLVLLTRRDPSLPIARLRGRGQMTEIRATDLRFTRAEAAAFITKMLDSPVDDATAALLDEKAEGWATGLRLLGLYLQEQDDPKHRLRELSGGSGHIAEYLVTEVLSRQKPEIATFLVETSILDRFCAPLCQAVHSGYVEGRNEGQNFEAQQFIEWLVEGNIFIIPLDDRGYWFRYHHLFKTFLWSRLRRQADADTIAGLHMNASNWLRENGLTDEAIRHALAAGDIEAAVRPVIEHRYDLMNTAQFIRLRGWLAQLPGEALAENPLLLSTQAFIGLDLGNDIDFLNCTEQAVHMLGRLSPESGEYAALKNEVNVLQSVLNMAMGNPERGIALAEEALCSLPPDALLIRSLGSLSLAVCRQMLGSPEQAVKVVEKALLNPTWPVNIRARIHFYRSIAHYLDADLTGAMTSSHECLRLVRGLPFTHTRTFASYLLGASHYCRNELTDAEPHLLSVLADCHASNPSYVGNTGFILACIYLARDCAEQAQEVLNRNRVHFRENNYPTMQAMTRAFQAEFALRQGEIKSAEQLSKSVDFDIRPPLWFFYIPQLTPVKLLLAEGTVGSLKEARSRLAELDEQMGRINRKSVRIDILALLALVCHKSGEETAALENLRAALALAEPGGWIRNFVDLGAPMRDLLELLNRVYPGHHYTQHVLDACRAEAEGNLSPIPDTPKQAGSYEQVPVSILTKREAEMLLLLSEGLSNKEIATKLNIAVETVKTHLGNIYKKLNARSRMEAVKEGRALGFLLSG